MVSVHTFDLVALHEMMHGIGFNHENDFISILNAYYPSSGSSGEGNDTWPVADDSLGLQTLYPDNTSGVDLAAVRYNRFGQNPLDIEYGSAALTHNLVKDVGTNNQVTQVSKGGSMDIEYSVHNIGSSAAANVKISFFLSIDRFTRPQSSDVDLGHVIRTMPAHSKVDSRVTVAVPANTPAGNYHVGYVVDPDHVFSHWNRGNNQTKIALDVPNLQTVISVTP